MKSFKRLVTGLVIVLLVILGLAMVTKDHQSTSTRPIRVVTSLNFYGEVASQVAGKYGSVESIINNASVDPHDYQPGTQQAKEVSTANLVITNGLGYDQWLSQLVTATNPKVRHINVATALAGKKDGDNEHVWYQPGVMEKLTKQLAQTFSQMDPQHASYYRQNAKQYLKQLNQVNSMIKQLRANAEHGSRLVDVSEPVFDYSLQGLGYRVNDPHFEKAVEDGDDPSPKDIQNIRQDIIHQRIAFFVVNKQSEDRVVTNLVNLAHQQHVPVLQVTESKPNGKTYVEWMLAQYRQLEQIQKGSADSSQS